MLIQELYELIKSLDKNTAIAINANNALADVQLIKEKISALEKALESQLKAEQKFKNLILGKEEENASA